MKKEETSENNKMALSLGHVNDEISSIKPYTELTDEDLSKLRSLGNIRNDSSASLVSTEVSDLSDQDNNEEDEEEISSDENHSPKLSSQTSTASATSSSNSSNRSVTFSPELVVRTHSLVVGNSPSCPLLPLQLDWSYDQETVDLEQHESSLQTRRRRQRGPKKLMFCERSDLLQDVAGYSPKELLDIKKQAIQRMKDQEEQKKKEDGQQQQQEPDEPIKRFRRKTATTSTASSRSDEK